MKTTTRTQLRPRGAMRQRSRPRWMLWLALLGGGLAVQLASADGRAWPPAGLPSRPATPAATPDPAEAPAEAPPEHGDDQTDQDQQEQESEARQPAVEANEPPEVTAARLAALPIAARARLLAVQRAVQARRAAGAHGIYVGEIHGEIELGLAYYTERVVHAAQDANALLLVWQIETPGGRVDAAVMMRDHILDSTVPSVAYVNRRAWSAGALISMANDLIVMGEGASIGAATPIQLGVGGTAQPVEEKVVSALRGEFRATAQATGRSAEVAESMVDADLAVGGIIPSGRLLTLTGREALRAGISEAEADNFDRLTDLLGVTGEPVTEINQSWAESIVRVLTSSTVSGLLMTVGMLGILFELMTPGFGWAGIMGITAIALFFAGHLLVHLAGMEELLLFLVGIVLLALEIFVIPGFGITGVLGILCIATSLVLALINLHIDLSLSPGGLTGALLRVAASLGGTLVGAIALLKLGPKTRVGRRLVLAHALASGPSLETAPAAGVEVGDEGVALTDLKPFGKARIGEQRHEVVAEGGYVDPGTPILVTRVAGGRIEVRARPSARPKARE